MVFEYNDYRKFLKKKIAENVSVKGYQTKLAEAAQCQRSVISQVLNGKANLSFEQAAKLASFWEMTEDEANYFLVLLGVERAGNSELRKYQKNQAAKLRSRSEDFANRFSEQELSQPAQAALYYSNWYHSAIHVLLSIPGMSTPSKISKRLKLSLSKVQESLLILKKLGLASKEGNHWSQEQQFLHLPKHSPMTAINHTNWRHKSITNIAEGDENDMHFSSAFTCSKEDFDTIRNIYLSAVDQTRGVVKDSGQEEVYGLNIDLFKI